MAKNQQNTHTNRSFNTEIADSDHIEVFATDDTYDKLSSVYKEDPHYDDHMKSHNIKPRPPENRGQQKIQISLWWLFLIVICILIAVVLTGVVTFFITKDRFTETLYAQDPNCYWSSWSSWSECSITCGHGLHVRIRQQMNKSMSCEYNETVESQICSRDPCSGEDDLSEMKFSRTALYKQWFISADNTVLSNVHTIETSNSPHAQLHNYRGTISDLCVGDNELIYYEVNFTYTIVNLLTGTNLVLEVGLSEQTKVDRYHYVGNKNVSGWSFHLGKSSNINGVYLFSQDVNSYRVWESFGNITAGTHVHGKFKLFINRRRNEFSLKQDNSIFHVFKNVTSSEKLCPVFAVFNPYWVHVKLQLMNPRNFTRYPW